MLKTMFKSILEKNVHLRAVQIKGLSSYIRDDTEKKKCCHNLCKKCGPFLNVMRTITKLKGIVSQMEQGTSPMLRGNQFTLGRTEM